MKLIARHTVSFEFPDPTMSACDGVFRQLAHDIVDRRDTFDDFLHRHFLLASRYSDRSLADARRLLKLRRYRREARAPGKVRRRSAARLRSPNSYPQESIVPVRKDGANRLRRHQGKVQLIVLRIR